MAKLTKSREYYDKISLQCYINCGKYGQNSVLASKKKCTIAIDNNLFMKEEIDLLSSSRNNKYLMFIFLVLDVHKFTCILSIIQCNKGICAVICSH